MKPVFSIIILIILCAYLAFIGYKVIAYNDDVFDVKTWSLKKQKQLEIPKKLKDSDKNAPAKKGLMCRLEQVNGKTLSSKGEAIIMDLKVPCTECNQYVYKNGNECISYEYNKKENESGGPDPIMGMCTPSAIEKAHECPFKKDRNSIDDVVPRELLKSIFQ